MSLEKLPHDITPSPLPQASPEGFHLLLDNKFEAAFTAGRVINMINHLEAVELMRGNALNNDQVTYFVGCLTDCCNKLERQLDDMSSIANCISDLALAIKPTPDDHERSRDQSEYVEAWLEEEADSLYPYTPRTRFERTGNDALVKILEMLKKFEDLESWVRFGLEIDQVFRADKLHQRLHKIPSRSVDSPVPFGAITETQSVALPPAPTSPIRRRDPWQANFYPGWQLLGEVHRNQTINGIFERYKGQLHLIPMESREPDERCEVIIANAVREQIRSVVQNVSTDEANSFKPLQIECLPDGSLKRNGKIAKLTDTPLRLVRLLLNDKCPLAVGKRSLKEKQFVSKPEIEKAMNYEKGSAPLGTLTSRTNDELAKINLQIISLKGSETGVPGKCIVDLLNQDDRLYADRRKSSKNIKVREPV